MILLLDTAGFFGQIRPQNTAPTPMGKEKYTPNISAHALFSSLMTFFRCFFGSIDSVSNKFVNCSFVGESWARSSEPKSAGPSI